MEGTLSLGELTIGSFPLAPDGCAPLDIKVVCNTNGEKTRENVQSALARGLKEVAPLPVNDRIAVLVGGGPSLAKTLEEIRNPPADVYALNAVAKYLNAQGIKPFMQVILDPRPENVGLIGDAHHYLIASQCAPEVFDALEGKDVGLFHMAGSALDQVNGTCIGGDVTVGLAAMCLTYTLGYRDIHLYGYDSSYADGEHHAYPQEQTDQESRTLDVKVRDQFGDFREFRTNFAMAKQAEIFPKVVKMLLDGDAMIGVHGEGLLPTIARSMMKPEPAKAAE